MVLFLFPSMALALAIAAVTPLPVVVFVASVVLRVAVPCPGDVVESSVLRGEFVGFSVASEESSRLSLCPAVVVVESLGCMFDAVD